VGNATVVLDGFKNERQGEYYEKSNDVVTLLATSWSVCGNPMNQISCFSACRQDQVYCCAHIVAVVAHDITDLVGLKAGVIHFEAACATGARKYIL
jgi:hypothetical protein